MGSLDAAVHRHHQCGDDLSHGKCPCKSDCRTRLPVDRDWLVSDPPSSRRRLRKIDSGCEVRRRSSAKVGAGLPPHAALATVRTGLGGWEGPWITLPHHTATRPRSTATPGPHIGGLAAPRAARPPAPTPAPRGSPTAASMPPRSY